MGGAAWWCEALGLGSLAGFIFMPLHKFFVLLGLLLFASMFLLFLRDSSSSSSSDSSNNLSTQSLT